MRQHRRRRVAQRAWRRSPRGDGAWTLEHDFPFGRYQVGARTAGMAWAGSFEVSDDAGDDRRVVVPRLP